MRPALATWRLLLPTILLAQKILIIELKTALGIGVFLVLCNLRYFEVWRNYSWRFMLGCSRAVAAEFTFFLAIPTMAGEACALLKGNTFTAPEGLFWALAAW